ncbi:predicted protein [Postia placenta Mad-698-R]|nr:predicted protein [Postia placenta Mad-698-R]
MFRDGTLYFCLSSILISRFLIHIRQAADGAERTLSGQSTIAFRNSQPRSTQRWSFSTAELAADMNHNTVQGDGLSSSSVIDGDDDDDFEETRDGEDRIENEESGVELQEVSPTAMRSM